MPEVLKLEREDSPFGKPFVIMERIEGRTMSSVLSSASAEKRRELMTMFCQLLVRLHSVEWKPFVSEVARYDTGDPYAFVDRQLDFLRSTFARFPIKGFAQVVEWLELRRDHVPCPRPSIIHWDFHTMNVLVRSDGTASVIDWTQIDVSDSRFDLAWTLLLMSSHRSAGTRTLILSEYERLAGVRVEQIDYFDVFACVKQLGSVAISLTYGPEKLGMRAEAVAMMKQQLGPLRSVYELLLNRTSIPVPEVEEMLETRC